MSKGKTAFRVGRKVWHRDGWYIGTVTEDVKTPQLSPFGGYEHIIKVNVDGRIQHYPHFELRVKNPIGNKR